MSATVTFLVMVLLTHVGFLGHVLTDLIKLKERLPDKQISISWMCVHRGYRLALSYLGAVAGFAVLWHIQDLSPITAVGVGYLSSDVFTEIGRTTGKRFQK